VVYRAGEHDDLTEFWGENGYRLPTEAEWEKAARGRRFQKRFPWGTDTVAHSQANYYAEPGATAYDVSLTSDSHPDYNDLPEPYTSPCGAFDPNSYGLFDMAGNVREFVADGNYAYSADYQVDPRYPPNDSAWRNRRGGSWQTAADQTQCAKRVLTTTGAGTSDTGFRCVRVD